MNEVAQPRGKALALCLIPFLMLAYFVVGALSNGIVIPGRDGTITLLRQAAWVACLFPLFWLSGDIIRNYPGITLSSTKRKVVASALTVTGIGLFFYAIYPVISS
ncbi:hypothetical protein ACJJI4_12920 [Microbulbifer sp. TRSA002]|uniref:hypothetical protein n=1 Tax=Microbulbifer sp. TRSA002 TaxID=3243382 RepID=UPI004039AA03